MHRTCPVTHPSATSAGMKAIHIAATSLAIAAQSVPAYAVPASPAGSRDVRCLMLSNLFSKTGPAAQARESARQARIFYIGRVSDTFTPARLEAAMAIEARTIDPERAGPDMNKCLASVEAAAMAVEVAGHKAAAAPAGPPVTR